MNKNVILLAIAQALMMSVNTLLLTAAAIIGMEMATIKALATLPLALQFLAIMLTTVPAAMLMKRIGRKSGFLISSAIGLLGGLSCVIGIIYQSFALFCIGTSCMGIYTGFGNYYRFTATEVSPPEHKNTAISYVLAGGVIAAILGPYMADLGKDILPITYLGSFIAVLLLYGLNTINFLMMDLPRPRGEIKHETTRSMREIASQPLYIVAVMSSAIGYSIMVILMVATPLEMTQVKHQFSDVAFVIQWHVLGMYVPSFFTGHLINYFSAQRVILGGAVMMVISVVVNLNGVTVPHFWLALMILGIGWNFMFTGGTSLLTDTYSPAESAKAQALHDFIAFSSVTFSSFGAGALHYLLGWRLVNYSVLPFILVCLTSMIWLRNTRRKITLSI